MKMIACSFNYIYRLRKSLYMLLLRDRILRATQMKIILVYKLVLRTTYVNLCYF